jgi:hypothetical protein
MAWGTNPLPPFSSTTGYHLFQPAREKWLGISLRGVKERKWKGAASIDHTEAWKNIQMQLDEKNADSFRQDKLVEGYGQEWRQGCHWIAVSPASELAFLCN